MQVYFFVYNVIYIKCDFSKLVAKNRKLILLASDYCLRELSSKNRSCFDKVSEIDRDFQEASLIEIQTIVEEYIAKYGKENVFILTNEESAQIPCARIREALGLQGERVNQVLPFVNKIICKNMLQDKVRIPKFVKFDKSEYTHEKENYLNFIESKLGYPMFSKPIDLVSSIETHKISSRTELEAIAEHMHHLNYQFEIDEFIDGALFHCDIILIDKSVKFFMAGKCSFALSRFFEGKPVGSIPVDDPELFNTLKQFALNALENLAPGSGAYHMEIFQQKDTNELVFLEVGARTGGALITKVYEKIYGINIEEINYKIKMGLIQDFNYHDQGLYAGFLNFPMIAGTVANITEPRLDVIHEFIHFIKIGQTVTDAENLLDISFSVLFWDKSFKKIEAIFEYLKNYAPIQYNKMHD